MSDIDLERIPILTPAISAAADAWSMNAAHAAQTARMISKRNERAKEWAEEYKINGPCQLDAVVLLQDGSAAIVTKEALNYFFEFNFVRNRTPFVAVVPRGPAMWGAMAEFETREVPAPYYPTMIFGCKVIAVGVRQ